MEDLIFGVMREHLQMAGDPDDPELNAIVGELMTATVKLARWMIANDPTEREPEPRKPTIKERLAQIPPEQLPKPKPYDEQPPLSVEGIQFMIDHYGEFPYINPATGKPFGQIT